MLFPFILSAQNISIHQNDVLRFGKMKSNIKIANSPVDIVDLNKTLFARKTTTVFGYLPYWEADTTIIKRLRFDLLTHIALFGFEALPTGLGKPPYNWPWASIFNTAHSQGVKLILSVYSFSANTIHTILTNQSVQQQLFADIENQVNAFNLDGVNIDFENLNDSDEGTNINLFMQNLSNYFHQRFTDFEISFAAPPINWNGDWNFASLSQSCDYLFLMEYDYFGKWSNITGPVSPLTGGVFNVNVTHSILQDYGEITNSNPKKLILGMPYFGARWETIDSTEGSKVVRFIDSPRYRDAKPLSEIKENIWSAQYQNPWYRWQNTGTTWEQVWYDNDSSLSAKYDLALDNNLKGIGIWALNYDGDLPELWDLMDRKLNDTATVVEEEVLPAKIKLFQNYPNPFNPTTVIEYSITAGNIGMQNVETEYIPSLRLQIYDILGRKIAVLVNKKSVKPGNYKIIFNAANLPSGIYFYQLSVSSSPGNIIKTKKMILLK